MPDLSGILLANVAAVLRKDTFTEVPPTQNQCILAHNEGLRDMVRRFLPGDIAGGIRTIGRIDKLLRQLGYEAETGNSGFALLPNDGAVYPTYPVFTPNICYYWLVELNGVPAVEVSSADIRRLGGGTLFAATAAKPVFTWGHIDTPASYDGIYYLPYPYTPTLGFHFVLMPAPMELSSAEGWPLDDDLMPADAFYALGVILKASGNETENQLGGLCEQLYEVSMSVYANPLAQGVSEEVV